VLPWQPALLDTTDGKYGVNMLKGGQGAKHETMAIVEKNH